MAIIDEAKAAVKKESEATPVMDDAKLELRGFLEGFGASSEVLVGLDMKGVESMEDLAYVSEEDLVSCGMKTIQARKLLTYLADKAKK